MNAPVPGALSRDDVELSSGPDGPAVVAAGTVGDASAWSWPPEAPFGPADGARFRTEQWAPPTVVRRPWVRVGRWTLLYHRRRPRALPARRSGC